MKLKNTLFFSILLVFVFVASCKKDKFVNPYDNAAKAPAETSSLATINPSNFAYLQAKIFQPTCANSGCHDGTFPPDFRTINSSYNTLVYQKPVNTANDAFRYRVFPYKADSSILFHRMTVPIGSGIMPIVVDPQSDWNANKNTYLTAIKNWINAGAKDIYGNYPKEGNKQPVITGFMAFPAGNTSTSYSRGGGTISAIDVPANSSVDLWFLIEDDVTLPQNMTDDTCKISKSMFGFTSPVTSIISYSSSGITGTDFTGSSASFKHKTTISTSGYTSGTYIYVRAYINDGDQGKATEIPNAGSSDIIAGYFALKIQ